MRALRARWVDLDERVLEGREVDDGSPDAGMGLLGRALFIDVEVDFGRLLSIGHKINQY